MHIDGRPQGFFYLDHRTVDSKCNIITDTFVTPGNVNDIKPYKERLKHQIEKYGFEVETVGLDAGYNTPAICKMLLEDFKIQAAMGKDEVANKNRNTENTNSHTFPIGMCISVRKEIILNM